jgi:hypothetical protein
MKHESKRPITIEDLLRLKRAERPPAEFWNQFDRELRAKQLAALVAKRPWWQSLPRLQFSLRRIALPAGALAIVAVTVFSVRNDQRVSTLTKTKPAVPVQKNVVADAEQPIPSRRVVDAETPELVAVVPQQSGAGAATISGVSRSLVSESHPQTDVAAGAASFSAVTDDTGSGGSSGFRSAPLVASGVLENAQTPHLLANAAGFENRVVAARSTVEPLHQMTPPGERTRAKLLTAMVAMASANLPARSSERVSDRLSEDRLYDQVRRFGARGAGVSMKF